MEGAADGVRVTVDAAWSDDRKVLCYLEEPANPATVTKGKLTKPPCFSK